MCSPSIPPAPAPPDYAEANREAIMADIETLPMRRRIEAEARLGLGEFEGLGDAELAAQMFQQQIEQAPEAAAALLDLQRQYGTQFAEEARRQLQATDPEGFALRQQFGDRLLNGRGTMEELANMLPDAPTYERMGNGPQYERIQDLADLADTGATAAGRSELERKIFDDLSMAGKLDPALQRAAEQAARSRGAARGNILGDSAALQEALAVQMAQREQDASRRSTALGFLQSGQSTSDTTNRLAQQNLQNRFATTSQRNQMAGQEFNDLMSAINQRNQASQNEYTGKLQGITAKQGARQQDLANIQSFLGLQPIVSQGSQLSGLQQGAAPFVGNTYSGTNINANAGAQGAQFAGNIFGTQTQQWQTQANAAAQGGFLNTLSKVAGAAGSLGSAYQSFCHVAREVYGNNNPDWVRFYFWKEDLSPWWFRLAYNQCSRIFAFAIRPFPKLKAAIRSWMDSKINTESATYG